LDVEAVSYSDGPGKQDCELNAAKRLLPRLRAEHRQLPVIITGDDLYSHEPMVELLASLRFHYLLVAKPESHKEMFEWVEEIDRLGESERGQWQEGPACKRRDFAYRIIREVPLSASRRVKVSMVEVWE